MDNNHSEDRSDHNRSALDPLVDWHLELKVQDGRIVHDGTKAKRSQ